MHVDDSPSWAGVEQPGRIRVQDPALEWILPLGDSLPVLQTTVPGPASREAVDRLAAHECPAITARRARRAAALGAVDDDPFVWARAQGANVEDVDGNVFVDLTAGFGVAAVGHAHPPSSLPGRRNSRGCPMRWGTPSRTRSRLRCSGALPP